MLPALLSLPNRRAELSASTARSESQKIARWLRSKNVIFTSSTPLQNMYHTIQVSTRSNHQSQGTKARVRVAPMTLPQLDYRARIFPNPMVIPSESLDCHSSYDLSSFQALHETGARWREIKASALQKFLYDDIAYD